MLYKIGRGLFKFIFKFFFKIEVAGADVFPSRQSFLLASNHLSNLDPVLLGVVCPCRVYYLGKEELFNNKFFAFILRRVGVIPLSRTGSDIGAIRRALNVLRDKSLVIFPQGTRSVDYDRFKSGVGFLHKKARVPIIAAKIYGTDKVFPKGSKLPRRGKIKVVFSRVMDIGDNTTYEDISSRVIEQIKVL